MQRSLTPSTRRAPTRSADPAPPTRSPERPTRIPPTDMALRVLGGVSVGNIPMASPEGRPAGPPVQARGPIQRTSWAHDGTSWNVVATATTDKDVHPQPHVKYPNANLGDTYDQQTGVYTSPMSQQLSQLGSSSGGMGFYDSRATTAYGYTNTSGKKRAGPHTMAHVSKRVAMAAGVNVGRDPFALIGSSALPRPRRLNRMLRQRMRDAKRHKWDKKTRKMRTKLLRQYKRKFRDMQNPKKSKKARLSALRSAMELNPATVYNVGSGTTTSAQIAGKGESRKQGAKDWQALLDNSNPSVMPTLHTMDLSGATPREKTEAQSMVGSISSWLKTGQVDEDDGSSESDSEVDDLDEDY